MLSVWDSPPLALFSNSARTFRLRVLRREHCALTPPSPSSAHQLISNGTNWMNSRLDALDRAPRSFRNITFFIMIDFARSFHSHEFIAVVVLSRSSSSLLSSLTSRFTKKLRMSLVSSASVRLHLQNHITNLESGPALLPNVRPSKCIFLPPARARVTPRPPMHRPALQAHTRTFAASVSMTRARRAPSLRVSSARSTHARPPV